MDLKLLPYRNPYFNKMVVLVSCDCSSVKGVGFSFYHFLNEPGKTELKVKYTHRE